MYSLGACEFSHGAPYSGPSLSGEIIAKLEYSELPQRGSLRLSQRL